MCLSLREPAQMKIRCYLINQFIQTISELKNMYMASRLNKLLIKKILIRKNSFLNYYVNDNNINRTFFIINIFLIIHICIEFRLCDCLIRPPSNTDNNECFYCYCSNPVGKMFGLLILHK